MFVHADNEQLGDRVMQDIRRGFITGGGYKQFGKDFETLLSVASNGVEGAGGNGC